jgi:hypothetical protein
MFKRTKLISLLIFLCSFYFTSFAQEESTVIKKLSKGADVILLGKVIKKVSNWNESRTRIYTTTNVQAEEYFKGTGNENNLVIRTLGGEVGDVGELYTHMPTFKDDEEMVVFLKKDENNKGYKVYNGEEGKITVITDEKTKEKVTNSKVRIKDLEAQIKRYVNEQ